MKRTAYTLTLLSLFFFSAVGQPTLIVEAPLNNSSTSSNRAPNGLSSHAYMRACFLVLANELTNIPPNTVLTTFGFTMNSGVAGSAVAGNFTVYLQNTNDVSYQKGTTYANAISGMTQVYAGMHTIPVSATTTSVTVTLSSPFTYTGGGMYVAYDWNSSGPFSTTAAVYLCESTVLALPSGGGGSAASGSSAPTTLGLTNFRPAYLFGFANPYNNDMHVIGIESPGRVAAMFNTPHTISAVVKNGSSAALNNVPVTLNVAGANVFTSTQTITTLAAGASTLINFAPFNPLSPGMNTISVSVPSDQNNVNNSRDYLQLVTCNEWAQNPARGIGSYTFNSVGFTTSGILASSYLNPVTSTLTGIRLAIATATNAVNSQLCGVLLSSAGVIQATTNTITVTSGMLNTYRTFTFSSPPVLSANTSYYLGFAQITGTTPAATTVGPYLPANIYAYTGLTGGSMTILTQNFGYFGIEAIFGHTVTVSAASQTVVCGNQATMNAVSSGNFSWSTGAQTSSIVVSPTVTTAYSVTASNTLGCMASTVASLVVAPIPVTITSSPSNLVCGATATITAASAGSHSWSTGGTGNFIVVSPTISTTYTVIATNTAGCESPWSYQLVVNPLPVTAASTSSAICLGGTVGLSASGATSYTWNTGSNPNAPGFTDSPNVTTLYSVIGSIPGGCINTASVLVTVQSFTALTVSNVSHTVCLGNTITVTAGGAASYTWDTGSSQSNAAVLVTAPAASGIYSVTGANAQGCTMTRTINVNVTSVPLAVTANTAVCTGGSITLAASGANTYTWTTFEQTPSIIVTPASTTVYSVNATGSAGCKTVAAVIVTVNPNPTVTAVPQRTAMCKFETNTLTAGGASSYSWTNLGTGTSVAINPTITSTPFFTVTGTDDKGCKGKAVISVKVNSCTGLREYGATGLVSVFPNPSDGAFQVVLGETEAGSVIEVYNSLGSLVKRQTATSGPNSVNLQEEAKGVYFLLVLSNGESVGHARLVLR